MIIIQVGGSLGRLYLVRCSSAPANGSKYHTDGKGKVKIGAELLLVKCSSANYGRITGNRIELWYYFQ